MKWKIYTSLIMAVIMIAVSGATVISADDNINSFSWFYDFENYTASYGSSVMPDERWIGTADNINKIGSYVEADGNVCLQQSYADISIKFDELLDKGRMHFGFNARFEDLTKLLWVKFYDGRGAEKDIYQTSDSTSRAFFINKTADKVTYLYQGDTGDMTYGYGVDGDETYDFSEWHRFDIVVDDMSLGSAATVSYYIDGEKINTKTVKTAGSMGFRALTFKVEKAHGNTYPTENVLIDNVVIERVDGAIYLKGFLTPKSKIVPRENAEIEVNLTDCVDKDMLTESNITITRLTDGQRVSDYTLTDITNDSFKINVNETLGSGQYKISLSSDIKGKSLGTSMSDGIIFRTEYASIPAEAKLLDDKFDTEALDNWSLISEDVDRTAITNGNGEENMAYGVTEVPVNESGWIVKKLPRPSNNEAEVTLSYDFKAKNMYWQLGLITDRVDTVTDNILKENVSLLQRRSDGGIYYSADGALRGSKIDDDLKIENDKWYNLNLKIKPMSNNRYEYTVTLSYDGNVICSPDPVIAQKDADDQKLYALGFGYIAVDDDASLLLDNITVKSDEYAYYPEVEDFKLYDNSGKPLDINFSITSVIGNAELSFNAPINSDDLDKIKFYVDGEENFDITKTNNIDESTGKSVVEITFNNLLEPLRYYGLKVENGIRHESFADLVSDASFAYSWKTKKDSNVVVSRNEYDESDGKYHFNISKNNNRALKLTAAVASYKVTDVDGKVYEKLIKMKYIPIDIKEGELELLEYSVDFNPTSEADKIKTFIWRFPSMYKLEITEGGIIK